MKNATAILALASLFALTACGGSTSSGSAAGSPGAAPTDRGHAATAVPASSGTPGNDASQAPGGAATPDSTPTPDTNLLSFKNGTRMVSYPATLQTDPDDLAIGGMSLKDGATGPFVFVYELPTTEHIDAFGVSLDAQEPSDSKHSATVAVSRKSATDGFSDVGTASPAAAESVQAIKAGVNARWVRVTYDGANGRGWSGITANGTMPGPRTGPAISRIFVEHDHPYKGGRDDGADMADDPWLVRVTTVGNGMTMLHCYSQKVGNSAPGTVANGRTFDYTHDGRAGHVVIDDEGTAMVGSESGSPIHYTATTQDPKYCEPDPVEGHGSNRIVVLDSEGHSDPYPLGEYTDRAKPYTFVRMPAALVEPSVLANANMVVLNGVCNSSHYFSPAQGKMLTDYVSAGHKLAIYNADMCGDVTAYDFLPYQFATSNPGASGAHGDRLIEVESDDLGSLDKTDAKRFLDAPAYAANEGNQIGDANTVTSKDDHWCGHLFGTNAKKINGFMQMYAPYGKGVFIFGGFDMDDNGVPSYQRMRDLEFGLTLPADLPCNVKVDMSFVLEPNRDATFVAGRATTMPFAMEVLANQGWKGHVNVTTTGEFTATVTPSSFDMDGGTQALALSVAIPATTKPGTYAVTVTGTDGAGKTSQAVIQFNGEAPLKKIPKKQKRIRLYGIHFDYNSAKIQPRSETVIREIADLMRDDATLRFQVEGHTDSDGGGPYNLKLSQARAQSVVTDLIHRYHIAASRLVPKGFGLSQPVTSNATAGGKALNRRVELLRL